MINKIILALGLLTVSSTFAQQGTASPYSFYGIGDQKFKGSNEIKSMGGLAVYQDSIHINMLNPASYANLQNTTLSLGFSNTSTNLSTQNVKDKSNRSSFDYFSLAFPAGKLGVSLGIMPYTFVGYKIANIEQDGAQTIAKEYNGEGGINRTYLGLGYNITPNLSIGVEAAYNFGDTENNSMQFITDDGTGLAIDRGSRQIISNDYSGFSFNTAVNYSVLFDKKMKLDFAATYSPEVNLKNTQTSTLSTISLSSTGSLGIVDQITNPSTERDLVIPQKYTFGVGYGKTHQWFLGIEYAGAQNSKLNNIYLNNAVYEDSHRYSMGGYYTPKYNSFTSYFDKITYRFGAKYENTGLVLNNQAINDASVNLGFGFPVSFNRDQSNINIGLEYGKRGTKSNGLIQENYFNVSVGFSFNDKWFQKRRYE